MAGHQEIQMAVVIENGGRVLVVRAEQSVPVVLEVPPGV